MALATAVTATTTQTIKLKPTVRRQLLTKLKAYAALRDEMNAIKAKMERYKDEVGALREGTGETSLSLEGFIVTEVTGVYSKLNKKKLVELGCSLAWIDEATGSKPKKPYTKITVPGEQPDRDEE